MKPYNKLVRDKIPEIMRNNGAIPVIRKLQNHEYIKELNKKLQEELQEYLNDENIEELADLEEVILAILDYRGITSEQFNQIREEKVSKRGAFKEKIYLERED